MKTTHLLIILAVFLFASCSSGKYYANYRVGGKGEKQIKPQQYDVVSKQKENRHNDSAVTLSLQSITDTFTLYVQHNEPLSLPQKTESHLSHHKQSLPVNNYVKRKPKKTNSIKKEIITPHFLPNHFAYVDHGTRIRTTFWVLIGFVVLSGIIAGLVMIPNAVLILLGIWGVILIALLLGAILAAFIDLIMPGDSMFSMKAKSRKMYKSIRPFLKKIFELYKKFLNKESLSTGQYILLFLTTLLIINLSVLFIFGLAVAIEVAAGILLFLAGITFVVLVTTLAMWLQPKHR